ncbi:MAG: 4Fe-4S binding protein [Gammaproteobacteria bacterium]|nr:4Fe-4S binding protein [Gammaproteobacteria bacterium]
MKQVFLKNARVVISLAFFIATVFVFVDFRGVLSEFSVSSILYLQFVPSLLKFIGTLSLAVLGFVLVILLTALYGRVYCSTICPLGLLQDLVSLISRKLKKKKKYKYRKPKNKIRYSLFAVTTVLFLSGSLSLLYMLDPFSIFGRLLTNVVRPLYLGLNNLASAGLESIGAYILNPENIAPANILVILFSIAISVLVIWMSFWHGRLYCNTICPVGTLLGLISRLSLFKIKFAEDLCTNCGECSIVCKTGCIDIKRKQIDFSRCVGCFNCIQSCPENGLTYRLIGRGRPEQETKSVDQPLRRKVLSVAIASIVGYLSLDKYAFAANLIKPKGQTNIPENKNFPVCPPGAIGIEHFMNSCTACHLCVSVCPTDVLQPSVFEYGILGFMQPTMDYAVNFCNYDCQKCSDVCPSGAILPLTQENKKLTQIGKVHFIQENCIVYTENTACGSCSEHCPTQAVHMVPYLNDLTIPEIDQNICIGCGACEYACPTRPYRAIFVDGNEIHQLAEKPEIKKIESVESEDFPF